VPHIDWTAAPVAPTVQYTNAIATAKTYGVVDLGLNPAWAQVSPVPSPTFVEGVDFRLEANEEFPMITSDECPIFAVEYLTDGRP
jgi:hypothetical protein